MRSSRRLVIPGWNSFRQICNVLFKLILKEKGTDQVQNSDLILKRIYIGVFCGQARALRTVAGKHRKCTKRNFKIAIKINKTFIFVETDLILSEHRTGSVPFQEFIVPRESQGFRGTL